MEKNIIKLALHNKKKYKLFFYFNDILFVHEM